MKIFSACAFVVGTAVLSGTSFVHAAAAAVRSADDAAVTPRPLTLEAALGNDAGMGSGSGSGRKPFEQQATTDKADAQYIHHPSIHRKKMMTMLPSRRREVGQQSAAATTQRRQKNGTSFHRKKMMTMLPPRSREVGQPIAAATIQRRQKNAKKNKDDDDHKHCSFMTFEGDYVFAKGCNGNSYHITISKHHMGYVYEGKPLSDGDSDAGCKYKSEPFTSEDVRITIDDDGHCMLDLIHLHDECDADRDLAVRVVRMDTDLFYLYYSNDKGFTFYNQEAPREAIRNPRRGLTSTYEDLHDLHNEAFRRLDCGDDDVPREGVPECSTKCSFCVKGGVYDDTIGNFGKCEQYCLGDCEQYRKKDGVGRRCCKEALQYDKICYLNDPDKGNTCKCGSEEAKACYIDMRCPETQTWQKIDSFPAQCRVKPEGECCITTLKAGRSKGCDPTAVNGKQYKVGTSCTVGYECAFKKGSSNDSDPRYCLEKEK